MQQIYTVSDVLSHIESNLNNPKAFNDYVDGCWKSYSSYEFLEQVKLIGLALIKLGIKKGDRVGIISAPSARWSIAEFAILSINAVSVPIFINVSHENFGFEVEHTGVKKIFVAGEEPWKHYDNHKEMFNTVISLEYEDTRQDVITYSEMLEMGKKVNEELPHLYEETLKKIETDDVGKIIFTSGTTGIPKGAQHTHRSLFAIVHQDIFKWDPLNDRFLSLLPLAHVFASVLNIAAVTWGISTYYFNDLKNIGQACRELHPTIVGVVPRMLEKIYNKMVTNIHNATCLRRTIGHFAFNLAHQEEESSFKKLFQPISDRFVYSQLREALGGSLRVVFSGGAALNHHLCHFFINVGLPIFEGWGQTEACPITVNRIGMVKIGTVGVPMDGVEVKLSPDREILVRGPIKMKGYYNDDKATAEVLDSEGWVHTGDKGFIDDEGFVSIIGRVKEEFKTSTGEMITPLPIEKILCQAPLVEQAVIVGQGRKFVSCLLVPDVDILKALKSQQNVPNMSNDEFLNSDYVKDEMKKYIDNVNEHLNHWEQIHAYRFLPNELSLTRGELTPTMKIVRSVVEKNYKDLIDSIYEEKI